ncbi:hypothetical protein EV11_1227 [Prochlorococcus sp. SS52]|nr:hypothetical protein EV04_0500 [Prochlorococcus marinus str. LG]KGG19147.1 hypothetical protein EV08_1634 [Prochlorococcus marinus str. SS2]KGG23312.1 hypothetical protein EV09_0936 [Prochlorococcus marinus str. SS35]KGG32453.1 hypothetical protein EV10_1568 [Prochlorococcus marinus str. SS51]KGG35663.1 hypothetical protein EV11_1227 [Prochlorococcus sp. SS52]
MRSNLTVLPFKYLVVLMGKNFIEFFLIKNLTFRGFLNGFLKLSSTI